MKKQILLVSSALAAIWAAPAFGQAAGPVAAEEAAAAQSANAAASGIQDIVVTAQRRAENLQKSSVSIEVLSADDLAGVTKPQDLTAISPGVVIANQGPQTQVYIRGVGDATGNSQGQAAVAFNIDGIYYGRQTAIGPSMFDIQRVEILKGPQGTLYGRNASGGAVNIITTRPKLDSVSGFAAGEVGNFELYRGEAAVNLPLASTVALRVAGQFTRRDGYLSNGTNDERTESIRARLLFEPSDGFSMLLNADFSHGGGLGGGLAVKPSPDGDKWRANTTPLPNGQLIWPFLFNAATRPLTAPNDYDLDNENWGVSLETNADLGFATLTFIPAYRSQDFKAVYYSANFRYAEHPKTDQLSAELRLSNDSSVLKWVAGLYYYNEVQTNFYSPTLNSLSAGIIHQDREALAAFAQATYSLTERFRLIGGARYTTEKVRGYYNNGIGAVNAVPYTATTPNTLVVPVKANDFSYKVGAELDIADQSMAYVTYATGFKAGGFTAGGLCGAIPFEPEKLKALTGGVRNRFFENKLQVNLEGFYWDYQDQQATFIGPNSCNVVQQLVLNPGNAKMKGGSIDVVFKPTSADNFRFSVEYTHSRYDTFRFTQPGLGIYAPAAASRCTPTPNATRPGFFDINCAGQALPRTPSWVGTASYERTFDLFDGEIALGVDGQFASGRWLDYGYAPNGRADAYAQFNADVTYRAPGDRWSIGAYVKNITDEAIYTGGSSHTVIAPNGFNYYVASIQPPRMYGARLRVKFGD